MVQDAQCQSQSQPMKPDDLFLEDRQAGEIWEEYLFKVLAQYWPDMLKPPKSTGMRDNGDMHVTVNLGSFVTTAVIGAKRRLQNRAEPFYFTDEHDYPYSTVIVDQENKLKSPFIDDAKYYALDEASKKTWIARFHSYWVASIDMSHVAVITPGTKRLWRLGQKRSWKDRCVRPQVNWECPTSAVRFGKFPEDVPTLLTWM